MKRYRIILLCVPVVNLIGCQIVPPSRYVQRDLTAPWVGRTYWSIPANSPMGSAMPASPGQRTVVETPRQSLPPACPGGDCG